MASRVDRQAIANLETWNEKLEACKNEAYRALDDLLDSYTYWKDGLVEDHLEDFIAIFNEIRKAIDDLGGEIDECSVMIKEKVLKLERLIYRR